MVSVINPKSNIIDNEGWTFCRVTGNGEEKSWNKNSTHPPVTKDPSKPQIKEDFEKSKPTETGGKIWKIQERNKSDTLSFSNLC